VAAIEAGTARIAMQKDGKVHDVRTTLGTAPIPPP
jgi:hypothetical protein